MSGRYADGLQGANGEVDTRAAGTPVLGQALVATGANSAAWQTPFAAVPLSITSNTTLPSNYSSTIERSLLIRSGIKMLVGLGSRLRIH